MEVMEVQSAEDGGADLLMECDEEEQEVWARVPEREEEEDGRDEALEVGPMEMEEEEEEEEEVQTDLPAVRIVPIPVPPVSCCSPSTHDNTPKSSGAPLGFKVNGGLVRLLPGGGAAELELRSHPGGSASGFNTVRFQSPAAIADPTPIITGVVSGEAAQKVLSVHSRNRSSPPLTPSSPVTETSPLAPSTSWTLVMTPPASQPPPPPGSIKPAAPHKLQHKGRLGPVSPSNCLVCMSQYKLIKQLRGFMCLCSPAIAQSLKDLKKKKKNQMRRRRHRKKSSKSPRDPQTSSKVFKTRPGPSASKVTPPPWTHRRADDFLSDRLTNPMVPPPHSTTRSPQQDQPEPPPPDLPHSKLVIMVDDFYYGLDRGGSGVRSNLLERKYEMPYRCIHCGKTLRNNIKLMAHMRKHSLNTREDGHGVDLECPHCFRRFLSPFKLQCHLEAVHSRCQSTATCKICEMDFLSEAAFLWHMKSTHKPGEMPYICQVCDFRSSFYLDVWSHFEQVHADTRHLLCQYCLRVMKSISCYQQHFARHQKKHVFGCDKCRLQFLYIRERIEHKLSHRTHIRPPQLIGLKPGTKVTVRTYSVVKGSENEEKPKKPVAPCKVVHVESRPKQEPPKRKPVKSLGPLLSSLSPESVSLPLQRCVECLSTVQDFRTHFPSLVHCSLCRFLTCCSTSYANHMINNHASCRKNPPYLTIFQASGRCSQRLSCVSCSFTTCRGDSMANHMIEKPEHHCSELNRAETLNQPPHNSDSVTSSPGEGGGAFIPIHLLPPGQPFTLLSVKRLHSPSPLSSPPAMTIKFLGPRPQPPEQGSGSPPSASQLAAVLSALCHGVSPPSRRHMTSDPDVGAWIRQREQRLSDRKWCWKTDKMAEWVLSQREQQLRVSEAALLQTARASLGEGAALADCYGWTVDFMLTHELGLQHHRGRLPRGARDKTRAFMHSLRSQVQSRGVPPHCVGSMDEFSIFIDPVLFSDQNPSALQLCGSPEARPVFDVVLSALSDGTFLPPLLFFRGTQSRVPEGFPDNVLLEARRDGFTDRDRLQIWTDQVWRPRMASHSECVLMVDVHRGHLTEEFRAGLRSLSTSGVFIPSGCCCRLQPLDVCVTPVLRDFLQTRWTQLVSEGGLEGLGLDQLALTLACWLSELSSTLNSQTHILRRSFASVCNLQQVEVDRGEAARMIAALTEALVHTPVTFEAPTDLDPEPEPQMELMLVMKEEVEQDPEEEEVVEQDPEEQEVEQDPEEEEVVGQDPEEQEVEQDPEEQEVVEQDPEEQEVEQDPEEQEVVEQDPEEEEVVGQDPEEEEVVEQDPEEEEVEQGEVEQDRDLLIKPALHRVFESNPD